MSTSLPLKATDVSHYSEIMEKLAAAGIDPKISSYAKGILYPALFQRPLSSPIPWPEHTMSNRFTDSNMIAMLQSRMGWNMNAPRCGFTRCAAYQQNDDTAVVFVLNNGKALLIEDDLQLFPSDALVTQLRMLEAA